MAVINLVNDMAVQLVIPFDRRAGPVLDTALDTIRERFGVGTVTQAGPSAGRVNA